MQMKMRCAYSLPIVFVRPFDKLVPSHLHAQFAGVGDEFAAQLLSIRLDVLGQAVQNRHPNDVRRQNKAVVLFVGQIRCLKEWVLLKPKGQKLSIGFDLFCLDIG